MEHDQEFINFNHALSLFTDEQFPYAYIEKRKNLDSSFHLYLSEDISHCQLTEIDSKTHSYFGHLSFEGKECFYRIKAHYKFNYEFQSTLHAHSLTEVQTFTDWENFIEKSKAEFKKESSLKKIVLHRKVRLHFENNLNATEILSSLPQLYDDQHFFIFKSKNEYFISYSPETLININDQKLQTISLAGTYPRSFDRAQDNELANSLLSDPKNVLEQKIVTDNIIDKLKKYCTNISCSTPIVLKQKHVQHIATQIQATIEGGDNKISALIRELHPTPALNGEPKELALKIIQQIEKEPRHYYGGAFGVFNQSSTHLIVGIRSFSFRESSSTIDLYGGCGILVESTAQSEWEETFNKMKFFIQHFYNQTK